MSGHSKWSTIKRKKGAADAARAKLFTKLIRELTVAAREGGGDEDANPRLRSAIQNARGANMPLDTIQRAVRRGTGDEPGAVYESSVYEGYGPAGVAIIVETLSDNKNRTVSEVRHAFTKRNGNLGEKGAVSWMFAQKGLIEVDGADATEEDVMLAVMDAGGEDIQSADTVFEVLCPVDSFEAVKRALDDAGMTYSQASLAWIPQNLLEVEGDDIAGILRLLEDLEDLDDVQKVFSNFDVQEEELAKLLA
ncbi:MAG: YebC/PmpR family DNA-binding transcriptional regulator [Candidatus Latescibacteria bacterium]|jgi:YebC/PmpR family DNA-binding regulatory protein|nr:YebC/PmpR family DNA-binding transcriptional regulator [Gemmatimonadaceae bacterium]MDP7449894.1 YebC/PmpR family DNA-binding transcriptional regulator [Candidatus Latescibacterota bacterium]HJP29739.1 YebC/PmpR family DNA-binding transcriptional regulator [Candidatus Latescibacterota bacterium]